jgi:signal transduction histidine kinase
MIRIASHDLKNPLAGIMGYIEMLRMDVIEKLTEKERGYLDKIEVAAKKMQRITTGILSLERIQQLSDQESHKVINLKKLVNQSVSEQMDFAVRSEQKVHRHLPEDDVYIQGDPLQMHEALSNLVQNAIKYTPKHGTVDVSIVVEKGIAKVRVVDTGYGIPKDQQDRLFSPFYRAKTTETRFIEGTGLGLHLVKNIIERHKGEMFFTSTYGKGSTFGFNIAVISSGMVGN